MPQRIRTRAKVRAEVCIGDLWVFRRVLVTGYSNGQYTVAYLIRDDNGKPHKARAQRYFNQLRNLDPQDLLVSTAEFNRQKRASRLAKSRAESQGQLTTIS